MSSGAIAPPLVNTHYLSNPVTVALVVELASPEVVAAIDREAMAIQEVIQRVLAEAECQAWELPQSILDAIETASVAAVPAAVGQPRRAARGTVRKLLHASPETRRAWLESADPVYQAALAGPSAVQASDPAEPLP